MAHLKQVDPASIRQRAFWCDHQDQDPRTCEVCGNTFCWTCSLDFFPLQAVADGKDLYQCPFCKKLTR